MPKNTAIILAGGFGSRMELDLPKQFMKIAGKMVLEHTVNAFENHPEIHEIAIVSHPKHFTKVEEIVLKNSWTKVRRILKGGEKRSDSSWSAIRAYQQEENIHLIFHDAVRPLVSQLLISENIKALQKYDAVDTAIPSADTIIRLEENIKYIADIPERKYLWQGQTPQSFKLQTIKKAYELALKDPHFKATDDCGVVKQYLPETDIFVVRGDQQNIKLTYKEDIYLLDKLFQLKSAEISRNPQLAPLKDKVIVVFGGSQGIGAEIVKIAQTIPAKVYAFSRKLNHTDVSKTEDIEKALKMVFQKEGKIDAIINTAGQLSKEPLNNMKPEDINQLIDVNFKGVINVARSAYPYLKKSGGHLLFYTSSSYTRGRAFYSIYSSTKAAIVNFVQAIAAEWENDHIKVNCINPERTKTQMRIKNFGQEPEETLLKPREVAVISLGTLCSNLNGQIVDIKVENNLNY